LTRRSSGQAIAALLATLLGVGCTGGVKPSSHGPRTSPPAATKLSIVRASFTLAAPVQREVAVMIGGRIYLAGGLNGSELSVAGVFSLDPATGGLTPLGNLPLAFHDGAGGVVEDHLIVFGGGANEGSSDAVQAFDFVARTGSLLSSLPKALSDVSSATVENTVYLVGGYDGRSPQSTIYATVDAIHFRVAGHLPVGLRYAAVAATGSNLVIAGGVSLHGPVSGVYLFDTGTGRTSAIGDLPAPVGHAAAFTLGAAVYVAGGMDAAGNAVRSVTELDVRGRSVVVLRPLPAAVSDAAVASDGTTVWLLGGWRGTALAQVLRATVASD
jgi:hypothetical protein